MDSTDDSFMQYHNANHNVDINQFLNGVQDFASFQDDTQGLDPALFDIGNGDTTAFHTQQVQPSQSNQPTYSQSTQPTQPQSPALPSYKTGQNTFAAHAYNPNFYEQRSMIHPAFDSQLAARSSASPQSFDHFYHSNINYNQQYTDPRFANFATQAQRQSTTTQPFRSQIPPHYMNMSNPSPQPQPQVSQVQNVPGLPYPYQQTAQTHRFIDPSSSMLTTSAHQYQSQNNTNETRPPQTSPYFQHTANTLNPRELQAQYGFQIQRPQNIQSTAQQPNGILPQYAHQSILQFQPQNVAASAVKPVKEPKIKAKKEGRKGGSASNSEDDLEIEDEPPEARPPIISVSKPNDQAGKLLWEVVDAVWSPHNKPASADKIRTAVAFVGEAVRGLRDQWKSQNEQLKKAELPTSDTASQAASLKAAVSAHRDTMERVVARVTQFGHPWIVKRLGENHFTLAALYSFLADRVTADDYDSSLVTGILQVGSKFETLDEEQLEKVKWTKVLNRFAKKSKNNSKNFAKQIIDNAKANTAKKSEAPGQGPSSPSGSASGKAVAPVAGVKRAREGSDPIQQAKKAAVKPSSKPLSLQIAEARKAKEKAAAAAATSVKDVKGDKGSANGTATVPARPKVTAAAPPKPSPFASLMSASKKPGTSNAERAAKDKADTVKKVESITSAVKKESLAKTDSPPNRPASTVPPASSFLGFLADMEKPKEAPTPKPEEILNETPDARARRLHKESRRRLRVSWKDESELVETRIFEHDPDEDTGHEDSMMRDAGDTMKEGEMLKQKINIDDLDEDEDEIEYSPPSDVDVDALASDILEQNFIKFGGSRKPESPSSEAQDRHEEGNLMTTYTSRDQPDSPKEPPEDGDDDDDFTPPLDFGEPSTDLIRQREKQILAQRQAYQPQQQPKTTGFDLASVLANMQPQATLQTQPQWQTSSLYPAQQAQPMSQQPSLQGLDISKILAVAQQMQQGQQQQQQPTYQAPPPAAQQQTTVDPNIAALLASFNQQAAAQAEASGHGPALPLGQGANPNPWPGAVNNEPHREQQPKGKKGKSQGKGKAPVGPDGLPLNYKTQVCQFWLEGRCSKGDLCTYKHSRD